MNKNYMEEIAKMLGVELEEEFYILNINGSKVACRTGNFIYHLNVEGLFNKNIGCGNEFNRFLNGTYKIERLPWKPKDDDSYYVIYANGNIDTEIFYHNSGTDLLRYKMGNCFRTREEEENDKERILEEFSAIKKE